MAPIPVPEIIAHRGASRECLENTLSAFDRALVQQADAIELDVHATTDGVVVVHHDFEIRDNRSGHADGTLVIADADFAELSKWRLLNEEPVPTLDAVLQRMAGRATVYVEIKGIGIEQQVADCLARHPNTKAAIHSFDHRIALKMRTLRPQTRTGILSASYVIDVAHVIKAAQANDFWQQSAMIDEALVRDAHNANARVIAWTENNFPHASTLASFGVDALCTDIPGALRKGFITPA
ncbi:MAG: glycerophosphodiester phosphodiesterase [Gemmatimonadaceae bacterium]